MVNVQPHLGSPEFNPDGTDEALDSDAISPDPPANHPTASFLLAASNAVGEKVSQSQRVFKDSGPRIGNGISALILAR